MRILLTTDTIGGVWTFTRELAQQFLSRGHQVALVSFGRSPSPEQANWCEETGAGWPCSFSFHADEAPLEWMQENDRAYAAGADILTKVASVFCPDVLHANQFCWGALPIAVPVVLTAHSDVCSWAAACNPSALRESPWLNTYRELVQAGLDGAAAIVAPTQWMADALGTHFRIANKPRVIPNGRNLRVPLHAGARRMQAVSVGRLWDEAKGIATLQEVISPVPILLAGEDRFQHEHKQHDAQHTTGTLRTQGSLTETELLRLFAQSEIYVASSLYEPFGLAPLEAALCGCAIVARDLPSLREVWGDAATYFRKAEDLYTVLTGLSQHGDALQAAQRNASTRASQYTAAHMADAYLSLFTQVQRKAGAQPGAEKWAAHAA